MNEIKLKGRLLSPIINKNTNEIRLARVGEEAEIILTPRELLEQLTHKEVGGLLDLINLPQPKQKEPIFFDCTLTKFAEQLDVPLWKAMEFGKYFQPKQELPKKKIERLNLPCFVHDYFLQHKDGFVSKALQVLNDHIGMLETKLNETIDKLNDL